MTGIEFLIVLVVGFVGYVVVYWAGYEDGYRSRDREALKEWMETRGEERYERVVDEA